MIEFKSEEQVIELVNNYKSSLRNDYYTDGSIIQRDDLC